MLREYCSVDRHDAAIVMACIHMLAWMISSFASTAHSSPASELLII